MDDVPQGNPHPTAHALRVFGGALGMGLIVAGLCILAAQTGAAFSGCARCGKIVAAAIVAMGLGFVLVRSAWRAMRPRVGGDGIR
ncbi:MAG TPA: hypothetical protein VIC55_03810 [Gemmatimonadaceae bacterium]|jgi:hypothetical protein